MALAGDAVATAKLELLIARNLRNKTSPMEPASKAPSEVLTAIIITVDADDALAAVASVPISTGGVESGGSDGVGVAVIEGVPLSPGGVGSTEAVRVVEGDADGEPVRVGESDGVPVTDGVDEGVVRIVGVCDGV